MGIREVGKGNIKLNSRFLCGLDGSMELDLSNCQVGVGNYTSRNLSTGRDFGLSSLSQLCLCNVAVL